MNTIDFTITNIHQSKNIFQGQKIIIYSIFRKKLVIEQKDASKIVVQSEKEILTERSRRGKTAIIDYKKIKLECQVNSDYKLKYIDKTVPIIKMFRQ